MRVSLPVIRKCLFSQPQTIRNCNRSFSTLDVRDEHIRLQKMCRVFAEIELKPIAGQLDKDGRFPKEHFEKLGSLGLMGMNVHQKYGGSGMDMLSACIAIEEISRGCASTGIAISIHNCLYANLLDTHGTDAQKEEFLKDYTHGTIGAFALSEPNAGSDVVNLSTEAKLDGDNYILNGTKAWVTSATEAKAGVIFATVDKSLKHKGITAFIVPFNAPGLSIGRKEEKMGIRATSTCSMVLQDVRVPKENQIGAVGQGFKIAMNTLQLARIGVAAQGLGIAQASLDLAISYSKERNMYGGQLIDMQLTKTKIAETATSLEAARLLTWQAARLKDAGEDFRKASSMAKLSAGLCAAAAANNCVQTLGGMGFVTDMAAERHYRDARITQIYGGANEVQQMIIADRVIDEQEKQVR